MNQTGAPPGIDAAGTSTPAEVFASVGIHAHHSGLPDRRSVEPITAANLVPQAQQNRWCSFSRTILRWSS